LKQDEKSINQILKSVPKSISDEIKNYILDSNKYKQIGIIGDLHIPFLDNKSFNTAIKYFHKIKIDCLIINGDFIDAYQLSKFLRNPAKSDLQNELDFATKIISILRQIFPKIKIIYKLGNHDARVKKFIYQHSELLNLRCLKLENLLELKRYNIELIEEKQLIQYSNYIIAHGDEIAASGLNPARLTLTKNYTNLIFCHVHRIDEFKHKTRDGKMLESYSVGAMCLNMDYWLHNNWCNGGLTITNKKGKISINNFRIEKGEIV
jgi:predicted phosphodiesterase